MTHIFFPNFRHSNLVHMGNNVSIKSQWDKEVIIVKIVKWFLIFFFNNKMYVTELLLRKSVDRGELLGDLKCASFLKPTSFRFLHDQTIKNTLLNAPLPFIVLCTVLMKSEAYLFQTLVRGKIKFSTAEIFFWKLVPIFLTNDRKPQKFSTIEGCVIKTLCGPSCVFFVVFLWRMFMVFFFLFIHLFVILRSSEDQLTSNPIKSTFFKILIKRKKYLTFYQTLICWLLFS